MNKTRLEWVEKAFAKMDKTGDKRVSFLKADYSNSDIEFLFKDHDRRLERSV